MQKHVKQNVSSGTKRKLDEGEALLEPPKKHLAMDNAETWGLLTLGLDVFDAVLNNLIKCATPYEMLTMKSVCKAFNSRITTKLVAQTMASVVTQRWRLEEGAISPEFAGVMENMYNWGWKRNFVRCCFLMHEAMVGSGRAIIDISVYPSNPCAVKYLSVGTKEETFYSFYNKPGSVTISDPVMEYGVPGKGVYPDPALRVLMDGFYYGPKLWDHTRTDCSKVWMWAFYRGHSTIIEDKEELEYRYRTADIDGDMEAMVDSVLDFLRDSAHAEFLNEFKALKCTTFPDTRVGYSLHASTHLKHVGTCLSCALIGCDEKKDAPENRLTASFSMRLCQPKMYGVQSCWCKEIVMDTGDHVGGVDCHQKAWRDEPVYQIRRGFIRNKKTGQDIPLNPLRRLLAIVYFELFGEQDV